MNLDPNEALICAVLRGESPLWPEDRSAGLVDRFLERSKYHGVQALLNERLNGARNGPPVILNALHRQAITRTVWELCHQQVLTQLLSVLAKISIRPVIFKGTALAYSLYTKPMSRERGDTDLIIQQQDHVRAHDALTSLGYNLIAGIRGEFISYQASYALKSPERGTHLVDLHWRINNSELLSRLFSYDELRCQAAPLTGLCADAIAAGPVHGLLLACMHRATHKQNPYYVDGSAYYGGDRLIWLCDIHLLASCFTARQWHDFVKEAKRKGLCAVCLEGIQHARARFHTRIPEFVVAALEEPVATEDVAIYLSASKLRQQWIDFSTIDGVSNQLHFLRELFFPPAVYMRSKYPEARPSWLPWLYVRRCVGGIIKRLSASRQTP
ncbi:MAG: nucleotidyltransferase family protein [Hyphomicrobium sp.]